MAIVGDAWVLIKAVTTGLKKDIKDGLDGAAKDAEKAGNRAGASYAEGFGDQAAKDLKKGLGHKLSDVLNDPDSAFNRRGRGLGATIGQGVLSGLGTALSGLMSLTGMFAMVTGLTGLIGGLVGALGALAAGAVAVTAALGPAMAAIGIVGVAGLGAFVAALGVGIGLFSQLNSEANANAPIVKEIKKNWSFMKDEFGATFREVANSTVFPELNDVLETLSFSAKGLSGGIFPIFRQGIEEIGTSIAGVLTKFHDLLHDEMFQGGLQSAFRSFAVLTDAFGSVLVDLVAVFVQLIAAAEPAIRMFAGWFKDWAANLRTLTEAGRSTGKLGEFMAKAATKAGQFFDIMGNLWQILRNVFKAASPLGGVFLDNFQKGTQALADFTSSAKGAAAVFDFFKPGGQVHRNTSAIWGLIKELGGSIGELTKARGIENLADGIRRLLPGVTDIVVDAVDAVGLLATSLADGLNSPEGLDGIEAVQRGLTDLGGAFTNLGPAIGPALAIIGDLGSNLADVLGPAFAALADALERARPAFDAIGQALGKVLLAAITAVLPLIVQLLDLVAELATAFAEPLANAIGAAGDIIGVLLTILSPIVGLLAKLAPLITAVGAAWATWAVAAVVARGVQILGSTLGFVALAAGRAGPAIGGAGVAVGALARALPILAVATVGLSLAFQSQQREMDGWIDGLRQGGAAADRARREMTEYAESTDDFALIARWVGENLGLIDSLDEVRERLHAQWEAMSPLEQATSKVSEWTTTYTQRLRDHGAAATDTRIAQERLAHWTAEAAVANYNVAMASGDYATATDLVAQALWREVDAQNAANGALASSELSAVGAAKAAEALAAAQESGDPLAIAGAQAQLNLQLESAVTAAQNAAKEYASSSEGMEKYGSAAAAMRASLETQIASLDDLISKTSGPAQQALIDLRGRLVELSGGTYDTDVNILTDDAMAKVLGLDGELAKVAGTKVTAEVFAATQEADNSISGVLTGLLKLDGTRSEAEVTAGTQDATLAINTVLGELFKLDNTSSSAEVLAATSEAEASIQSIIFKMMGVDETTATPEIRAQVESAQAGIDDIVGKLVGLDLQSANPAVVVDTTKPEADIAGVASALLGVDNTTANPTVALNSGPFRGVHRDTHNLLEGLDRSRATATANMNADPFNTRLTTTMLGLNNLNGRVVAPTVTAIDRASPIAASVQRVLDGVRDKTITLTTINRTVNETVHGSNTRATRAGGGLVDTDSWTTVGEEGRELVFLSQGQYVATYQKTQKILAAASIQAAGMGSSRGGTTTLAPVPVAGGGNVTIPITVNPSAQMDELDLARKTGREFAFQYRKLT